ncbi:MAG: glycosyltransferase family 4 protein [Candidatus Thorarchaeota archaeon]|nr:glycosyltransferase family 4 protein [Candidatus Thorarchaeota archaeon]
MVLERFGEDASTYRHLVDLANELGSLGLSVYILSANISRNYPQLNRNVTVVRLRKPRSVLVEIPTTAISIAKAVDKYSLDILYGHIISKILLSTIIAGKLKSKKTVLWHCGLDNNERRTLQAKIRIGDLLGFERIRVMLLLKLIFVQSIKRASKLLTGTDEMKAVYSKLVGIPERNISVIPGFVDTNLFYPKEASHIRKKLGYTTQEFVFVYVGRLSEQKGVRILIQAFAKASKNSFNVKLLLIGGHSSDRQLEAQRIRYYRKLCSELGIANKVKFTGSISNRSIPEFLSASDVLVLPSKLEGFPRVLIEAMACGLPVLATKSLGNEEIVINGTTGILVKGGSAKEFARGMIQMTEDSNVDNMGESARNHAIENFGISVIASKYKKLFESL